MYKHPPESKMVSFRVKFYMATYNNIYKTNQSTMKTIRINQNPEILNYINNTLFKIPKDKMFVFSPKYPSAFSPRGQAMVEALIAITPQFHEEFNRLYSIELQSKTASGLFRIKHEEALINLQQRGVDPRKLELKQLAYYEVNRVFPYLVSKQYKRTLAPRITTVGSTFHGMKKEFKYEILKRLSLEGYVFIDCDMSACHSRVAAALVRTFTSQISKSLEDGNFWKGQVAQMKPLFTNQNVDIPDDVIKKVLKVMLYTSLNGGNPASEARLIDNLSLNAKDYVESNNLKDPSDLVKSSIFISAENAAKRFDLANELKELNKECVVHAPLTNRYFTHTVDRIQPYISESVHLGISRVLQGFEVVLLTILVKCALENNGLPISLDHDGILLMVDKDTNIDEFMHKLSSGFEPWSKYLLNRKVPLEIKFKLKDGVFQ